MFEDKPWYKYLPPENINICESNLTEFFYTMYERQEIWYKRFIRKADRPWTKDQIFANYKFTNVYRELDNSSQYLIKNVFLNKKLDERQKVFAVLVHRIFNKAETFEKLGGYPNVYTWNTNDFLTKLQKLENAGVKTLNQEAYKINTYIWGGVPRWKAYTENIIQHLHNRFELLYKTITEYDAAGVIADLRRTWGLGMFLAHEYYQDFCDMNTYVAPKFTGFNKNDFTNVGPGCSVGIRLIFPSLQTKDQQEGIYWLRDLSAEYLEWEAKSRRDRFGFKYLQWDRAVQRYYVNDDWNITLHNIEMWLCEYQKYWKMKNEIGKQRQPFTPVTKQI